MAFATFIMAVGTISLAIYSSKTLKEQRQYNKDQKKYYEEELLSQKQFYEQTTRPFVGIQTKYETNIYDSNKFNYYINNYGNSPAINVNMGTRVFLSDDSLFVIEEFNPNDASIVLFPGETNSISTGKIIKNVNVQFMNICVFYSDTRGNKYRTTTIFVMYFIKDHTEVSITPIKTVFDDSPKDMNIVRRKIVK
jgi:hypothetical protein